VLVRALVGSADGGEPDEFRSSSIDEVCARLAEYLNERVS
jgi:hypothetical protein